MRLLACALASAVLVSTACETAPTDPADSTDPGTSLTGTWRGNITVTGATAVMTWTLTQTGNSVTGPVVIALPTGVVLMNGTVSGTLSGTTLSYVVTVPAGGIASQPGCSGVISGATVVATMTTMNGTYTVVNSTCTTGLTNGLFTLTR
jgi:hypothetical protein